MRVDAGAGRAFATVPEAGVVRSARRDDARGIAELVNAHARRGLTLPRTRQSVLSCIGEFVVVERAGRVIACGALNAISPSLGEIRSIACASEAQGTGAGRQVVSLLIDMGGALELDELVLLTRIPAFFARFGFVEIEPERAPRVFLEEAIAGRGRTIEGRTIMHQSILGDR